MLRRVTPGGVVGIRGRPDFSRFDPHPDVDGLHAGGPRSEEEEDANDDEELYGRRKVEAPGTSGRVAFNGSLIITPGSWP